MAAGAASFSCGCSGWLGGECTSCSLGAFEDVPVLHLRILSECPGKKAALVVSLDLEGDRKAANSLLVYSGDHVCPAL